MSTLALQVRGDRCSRSRVECLDNLGLRNRRQLLSTTRSARADRMSEITVQSLEEMDQLPNALDRTQNLTKCLFRPSKPLYPGQKRHKFRSRKASHSDPMLLPDATIDYRKRSSRYAAVAAGRGRELGSRC